MSIKDKFDVAPKYTHIMCNFPDEDHQKRVVDFDVPSYKKKCFIPTVTGNG